MRKLRAGSIPASLCAKLRFSLGGDAETVQSAQLVFLFPEHVLRAEQCFQHWRDHTSRMTCPPLCPSPQGTNWENKEPRGNKLQHRGYTSQAGNKHNFSKSFRVWQYYYKLEKLISNFMKKKKKKKMGDKPLELCSLGRIKDLEI